jgi:hypothetical protein
MIEEPKKRKSLRETIGTDNCTFICVWPKNLRKLIKASAAIRNETVNTWVMRCIVEQIEREKKYT